MNALQMQQGESALITSVKDSLSGKRLKEMGFVPGRTITLTGKGPFGDPLAFEVGLLHAALRVEEAELIEIDKPFRI
jgi:ferrous iron transport protein A